MAKQIEISSRTAAPPPGNNPHLWGKPPYYRTFWYGRSVQGQISGREMSWGRFLGIDVQGRCHAGRYLGERCLEGWCQGGRCLEGSCLGGRCTRGRYPSGRCPEEDALGGDIQVGDAQGRCPVGDVQRRCPWGRCPREMPSGRCAGKMSNWRCPRERCPRERCPVERCSRERCAREMICPGRRCWGDVVMRL